MFYSLMIRFWILYVFVIFHLWVRLKCFIQKFDWMNVIFGYHAYPYGTQEYSYGKVWYSRFPRPCSMHFSDVWMRLYVVVKFEFLEYFSSKSSHFRMSFHIYLNHRCFKLYKFWSSKSMGMVVTAWENLSIILTRTNTFGYHTGTHGTRKGHSFNRLFE